MEIISALALPVILIVLFIMFRREMFQGKQYLSNHLAYEVKRSEGKLQHVDLVVKRDQIKAVKSLSDEINQLATSLDTTKAKATIEKVDKDIESILGDFKL